VYTERIRCMINRYFLAVPSTPLSRPDYMGDERCVNAGMSAGENVWVIQRWYVCPSHLLESFFDLQRVWVAKK